VAARFLGVCERTFRRYIDPYEEAGMEGLIDQRLGQVSHRRVRVDEVMALTTSYRARHQGCSANHYYAWYRRAGGKRRSDAVAMQVPVYSDRRAHNGRRGS
jgi:hypothetical protein